MICTRNCCWSWSVALLRICPSEMVHLASHRFLMVAICFYNLDLSWAWAYKSNVLYFRTCRTLQKIFLVSLLMIFAYICYMNWSVSFCTCPTPLLRLAAQWILMFVIYSRYWDLLYSWWHIMTNLIYFSSWNTKFFIIPVSLAFTYSFYWRWCVILFWICAMATLYIASQVLSLVVFFPTYIVVCDV